jgi:hypothetical protein
MVNPATTLAFAGPTLIEDNVAGVTVNMSWPVTPLITAVTELVPDATPVASPDAEIVAMPGALEAHVTDEETSFLLPSLYTPVAAN